MMTSSCKLDRLSELVAAKSDTEARNLQLGNDSYAMTLPYCLEWIHCCAKVTQHSPTSIRTNAGVTEEGVAR